MHRTSLLIVNDLPLRDVSRVKAYEDDGVERANNPLPSGRLCGRKDTRRGDTSIMSFDVNDRRWVVPASIFIV